MIFLVSGSILSFFSLSFFLFFPIFFLCIRWPTYLFISLFLHFSSSMFLPRRESTHFSPFWAWIRILLRSKISYFLFPSSPVIKDYGRRKCNFTSKLDTLFTYFSPYIEGEYIRKIFYPYSLRYVSFQSHMQAEPKSSTISHILSERNLRFMKNWNYVSVKFFLFKTIFTAVSVELCSRIEGCNPTDSTVTLTTNSNDTFKMDQ